MTVQFAKGVVLAILHIIKVVLDCASTNRNACWTCVDVARRGVSLDSVCDGRFVTCGYTVYTTIELDLNPKQYRFHVVTIIIFFCDSCCTLKWATYS